MSTNTTVDRSVMEITQSKPSQVDREAGVIRGVKVLGAESRNRRRYPQEVVARAKSLYEGCVVNFDHGPIKDATGERSVGDRAGWLQDVREAQDGGLTADLHLLLSDPRSGKVLEAAEKRPELFGLSHFADVKSRRQGGQEIVEEIYRVRSVDVVSDPASTKSLFESLESDLPLNHKDPKTMKKTVKEILQSHAKNERAKRLLTVLEQDDLAPVAAAPVELAEPAPEAEDQIWQAFRQAVIAVLDNEELDMAETMKRIKEILTSYEKREAKAEERPEAPPAGEQPPAGESATAAAVQRELASLRAKVQKAEGENAAYRLLQEARLPANPAWVEALAVLPADKRKTFVESLPRDQYRPPRSGATVRESEGSGQAPKDDKEFVERLLD